MPEIRQLTRLRQPFTIQEVTEDESTDLFRILDRDGVSVFSIDRQGVLTQAAAGQQDIPKNLVNAKGDLIAASADNTVDRFAVGADGTRLVADSSQTLGLRWADSSITLNTQSGAAYTLALTDAGKVVGLDHGSANTITIPLNATVAFPVGTEIGLRQPGAGQTTIAITGGGTLRSRGSVFKLAGQYAHAALLKVATDTWELSGDIAA